MKCSAAQVADASGTSCTIELTEELTTRLPADQYPIPACQEVSKQNNQLVENTNNGKLN